MLIKRLAVQGLIPARLGADRIHLINVQNHSCSSFFCAIGLPPSNEENPIAFVHSRRFV